MTTESSLKLTEAVIDVLRGGPRKFKELYRLLAERLPEKFPHAGHDGAYTVKLADMTRLQDLAAILEKVAVNNAGLWHLKDMTQPEHSVQEVKNIFEPVRLNPKPSLAPVPAMGENGPTPQKERLNILNKQHPIATDHRAFLEKDLLNSGMSLGNPRNKGQKVNSEEMLKSILSEGKQLNSERYYEHCRKGHVKTFYFFCLKLSSDVGNPALSSAELGQFIVEELRRCRVVVNKELNPQGWFGKAWTDWNDASKDEKHFRDEYCRVLIRTGENPYFYQINPEYIGSVRKILDEIQARA